MKYLISLLLAVLPVVVRAADPAARPADTDISAITSQLSSNSPDERQTGIGALRELIRLQPMRTSSPLRGSWSKLLLDAKEYVAADELGLCQILANPGDTYGVEGALQLRIRACIALGKADVALSHAKSLYNVSSMSSTSTAMLMVAECLTAQSPGDSKRLNQFKAEQIAGSKSGDPTTTTAYTIKTTYGSPVLGSIKVDAEPYLAKARTTFAEDYWSLLSRGNLMLLADRPADAKELLERAYSTATEGQLVNATESLARCIKAQDGVIGRANTWLLSLRPKPEQRK